jgi:hypothetical protein
VAALTFDNELKAATPTNQDGVRFYYWQSIPSVLIDYQAQQHSVGPGYVMVYLSLKDPTYTNYSRAIVIGGGVTCEILASHPTGAAIRAMSDMRGRTLDIQFSKNPISLN